MRLSLCVLLVTLALCCYEANAKVCPARMSELRSFYLDTEEMYNLRLLMFAPPREAAEAMVKVKQCVDLAPLEGRKRFYNVLKEVESKCNN
ncbi:secretoglobin family 1D member 2-like [Sturnira hondurensis]|uniref:secretoglobin family 1D member 2-like n=1 Tax=Sturnira hondurensis TaxID=192404 RepID=UPI00187AB744|nr:secretoglobin family 1D member 2-like [Sturnira hondurensis]